MQLIVARPVGLRLTGRASRGPGAAALAPPRAGRQPSRTPPPWHRRGRHGSRAPVYAFRHSRGAGNRLVPWRGYGVLKGQAQAMRREDADPRSPHYQILLRAGGLPYRVAVNVRSTTRPADLLFLVVPAFVHPLTAGLTALDAGFTPLPGEPDGGGLDYVRGGLFDRAQLQTLPATRPGPGNDLADALDAYLTGALQEPGAWVYAFGTPWGPESRRDPVFQFRPGRGIHNIHMNQGNDPGHAGEDSVWQDGGLLLQFPSTGEWAALFLAFQSQSWQTDDRTGHARRS
ncbi:MAG TPA: YukJ family protein [Chloroflexia bacterium]|nr:YukJ family protein [Chloroflexia bacterium]